jgi:hypothetical protein
MSSHNFSLRSSFAGSSSFLAIPEKFGQATLQDLVSAVVQN